MKLNLTTERAMALLKALSGLDGAPRAVGGRVIVEAFDLSDKVRWNTAKNRRKLREYAELLNEENAKLGKELAAFMATLDPQADPKVNQLKTLEKRKELDERLNTYAQQPNEIDLLRLPVEGLNLRVNRLLTPATIEQLMDLIDGEPVFDEPKPVPAPAPAK